MPRTTVVLTHNRFPEIARALPREVGEIVEETVLDIETNIKIGMASSHNGEWYGSHQASAPGEMPAIDTGALAASIQTDVQKTKGTVYTNMEYSEFLEYGTVNMEARPYFTPAAEAARGPFLRKLRALESRL
jgi:phage gpG-like protein